MNKQLIHAEWIGKHAKIIRADNPSLEGIEGTIVDETKHTITIETRKGNKNAPKKGTVFQINGEQINGDDAIAAPEERIKLKVN